VEVNLRSFYTPTRDQASWSDPQTQLAGRWNIKERNPTGNRHPVRPGSKPVSWAVRYGR